MEAVLFRHIRCIKGGDESMLRPESEIREQLEKDRRLIGSNPSSAGWVCALEWVLCENDPTLKKVPK